MYLGTDSITPEQRVAVSDPRFDMRMTGNLDSENALSTGWTWVAAVLVAAMFIVSGYLDEESRSTESSTASGPAEGYTANTAMPSAAVAASPGQGRK